MGNVDSRAKEYFSDNERFADLCNYVLYDGEPVIQPDFLEEKDTTEVLSVFGTDQKQIHIQKWRDLLRGTVIRSYQGVCLILIGVEAQADIHYAMPVKNMIYDALNYGYQVKEAARKHKQVFFVKHFSLKKASKFPVFVQGISLLSAGDIYASLRMRACSIR